MRTSDQTSPYAAPASSPCLPLNGLVGHEEGTKEGREAVIIQAVVPHYRIPVFEGIAERLPGIEIIGGSDYFTPAIKNSAAGRAWFRFAENRFFLGRRLLWQKDIVGRSCRAGVVIAEFNPRMLTVVVVALLRRVLGRPMIFWGHVGKAAQPRTPEGWLRRSLLRLASGFVAYTRSDENKLRAAGFRRPVWVTNNSCVPRLECEFELRTERCDILYVGRLVREKKVSLLIDAFAQAASRLPAEVRLVIAGDGPEAASLHAQAQRLGIAPRVEFLGAQTDALYLKNRYSKAFLAVSPGYVGLSVVQSLAYGVPMLIARHEPHSPEIEVCQEGVNSIFFPSDDAAGGAEEIVGAWASRAQWKKKGPLIAQTIADTYTFEAMTDALVSAITSRGLKPTQKEKM